MKYKNLNNGANTKKRGCYTKLASKGTNSVKCV